MWRRPQLIVSLSSAQPTHCLRRKGIDKHLYQVDWHKDSEEKAFKTGVRDPQTLSLSTLIPLSISHSLAPLAVHAQTHAAPTLTHAPDLRRSASTRATLARRSYWVRLLSCRRRDCAVGGGQPGDCARAEQAVGTRTHDRQAQRPFAASS